MKLFYYSSINGVGNFGDELNHDVWRHFLPGAFEHDEGTLFVGIGTLLSERVPKARRTVVFGSGAGYHKLPTPDPTWHFYCVRGPLTAQALGLSANVAVTDPAALVPDLPNVGPRPRRWKYAYMPHWRGDVDAWSEVCEGIDFGFIDPRWPTDRVLDALSSTEILLAEAMHGAIVADALRIPWIPIRTSSKINTFKWEDWCGSLDLEYRPYNVPKIWPPTPGAGIIRTARRWGRLKLVGGALRRIARRQQPQLSRADLLRARTSELRERLARVRKNELPAISRA